MSSLLTRPAVEAPRLLLTSRQAADALAICPRLLWDLTNRGEIVCLRLPGRGKARAIRYDVADLQRWIERTKLAGEAQVTGQVSGHPETGGAA